MVGKCFLLACMAASLWGEPVAVRYLEGEVHGFVVLRTLDGALVANGDSLQVAKGDQVTNRLVYHFKDGSVQDETVVFSQRGHFRLLSDHLVQKGPTFKHPMDVSVNGATGMVTVRTGDRTETTHLDLPPDLANGMVPVFLKNLGPGSQSAELSMVVATPKPILVKLLITPQGEDSFTTGGTGHKATRFNIKVDIGGLRGVIAPLVGKQPPDTQVWVLPGSFPAFLKSQGPMFEGGPIWLTELVSPAWPAHSARNR